MCKKLVILSGMCVLVLIPVVAARAGKKRPANVAGVWQISLQESHGRVINTLTVTQEGGKIRGMLESSTYDVLFTGAVVGDKIRFGASYKSNGFSVPMTFTGTVAGDTMAGTETVKFLSTRMELHWTAKRAR